MVPLPPWYCWPSCSLRAGTNALAHPPTRPPLLTLPLVPNRPWTRAYVRAVFGKAAGSTAVGPAINDQAAAPAAKSAALSANASSGAAQLEAIGGTGVLLDSTARRRVGLSWYQPARVQLLAAPPDGETDVPSWSAFVVDGVTFPYDAVVRVRMDESALELVVEHEQRNLAPGQDELSPQHFHMATRSEFNLWREALSPKMSTPTLVSGASAASKPSAVHAAQKWLIDNLTEGAAVP